MKPGNSGGAKGVRKMDAHERTFGTHTGGNADGSISRSRTLLLEECETVSLDDAHVGGSHRGSEGRNMVQAV
jgi:hypothetical protein